MEQLFNLIFLLVFFLKESEMILSAHIYGSKSKSTLQGQVLEQ